MYPRISDMIYDLTGLNVPLPFQTFGFFMALSFIVGYYVVRHELWRKEKLGIFPVKKIKAPRKAPISIPYIVGYAIFYTLLGYKLVHALFHYAEFSENPQAFMLNWEGAWWGGLLVGGGMSIYNVLRYQKQQKSEPELVLQRWGIVEELGNIFTIAFVAGLLGAKLFHNLEYWEEFLKHPWESLTSFSGLTFYGGLLFAGIGIGYYVVKKGYALLPFADASALILMLGYGIGRIGCHMSGDGDWGINNYGPKPEWLSWLPDTWWAYDYPHNVLMQGVLIPGCEGPFCYRLATPVFPTPIYEVFMALLIFAGLWMLRKRLPYWGQLSGIYLFFNGMERFWIEKIRVNAKLQLWGIEFTQAELIAVLLMLFGVILFYLTTFVWKYREAPAPAAAVAAQQDGRRKEETLD